MPSAVAVPERDYERAFATMKTERAGALCVAPSPVLSSDRKRIIELAARERLPAIYDRREHVEGGGLVVRADNVME